MKGRHESPDDERAPPPGDSRPSAAGALRLAVAARLLDLGALYVFNVGLNHL